MVPSMELAIAVIVLAVGLTLEHDRTAEVRARIHDWRTRR
jgi:hypothetical protein